MTAAHQCIPTFTLKQRRSKSWISSEVLSPVRKKRRAYCTAKHSQNSKHQQQYKSLCNTVRNLTRRDRLHHVNQITKEIHHDQKPFWRWLINTKGGHHSIPDIHHQGNILSTAYKKAVALNSFFTSVFTKAVSFNINEFRQRLLSRSTAEFKGITFNPDDVYKLLCAIDPFKSSGPKDIPGRLLKEGALCIAEPLAKLYNMSMSQGQLPKE